MKKNNLCFRGLKFVVLIPCLFSIVAFSKPAATAEKTDVKQTNTGDTNQKGNSFSPKLELEMLNSLIARNGNNADYFYNRGWVYEYTGKTDEAEKDYSRAVEIDKKQVDAFYNRGVIYMKKGRYDLAIKDFSEVIGLKPGSADAYCNRGNAYLQIGETEKALKDYTSAIKIAPQDPDLYYNRALLYLSKGEKVKALEDMKEAARLGHDKAREYLKTSGNKL